MEILITIGGFLLGFGILLFLGKILGFTLKWTLRLVKNALLGGLTLLLFNLLGGIFNLYISINFITALIVGFLGLPGIVLILILQYL